MVRRTFLLLSCAGLTRVTGTHVTGIIGALPNNFGFTGVAPGATLGHYRVRPIPSAFPGAPTDVCSFRSLDAPALSEKTSFVPPFSPLAAILLTLSLSHPRSLLVSFEEYRMAATS